MAETAVVVVFPELEPLIGRFRREHTPSGARGMPAHATLVVPFADSEAVSAEDLVAIARVFEPFAPFELRFRETARFPGTLYLRPERGRPLVALTEALVAAFPAFPPYGGEFPEIIPHVTVANGDERVLSRVEPGLAGSFDLTVRVERVWLFENAAAGWKRHTSFPLDRRKRV